NNVVENNNNNVAENNKVKRGGYKKEFDKEEDNPPPPHHEDNSYIDKGQEKENEGGDLLTCIKNNFSKEMQGMLLSVQTNTESDHFTIGFLTAFKEAHRKTKHLKMNSTAIRKELQNLLLDIEAGM